MNDDEDEQAKNLLKPSNTVVIHGVIFNKTKSFLNFITLKSFFKPN